MQNLEEICREWAPRLGLAHWEISIRWADEKDIEEMGPWADANVKYKFCVERAAIRVKKEEDCKPLDANDSYDAEELIVHVERPSKNGASFNHIRQILLVLDVYRIKN